MSDPKAPNDPAGDDAVARTAVDEAYAEAEAMMRDDNERAARRARVLAAVAAAQAAPEPQTEPAAASAPVAASLPPPRKAAWKPAPWLAAAGVAGIAALVSFRITPPATVRPPQIAPAPEPPAPETPVAGKAAAPSPTAMTPAPAPVPARAPPPPPPKLQPRPPIALPDAPSIPPLPVPPVERRIETPEPPRLPLPIPSEERRVPAPEAAMAPTASAEMATSGKRSAADATVTGNSARLAAAAVAGDTGEIGRLLAAGLPVDVADEAGETALMKAVRANRPKAVTALRHAGADLDRRSRAGISARDLAATMDDRRMNHALGIEP